MKLEATRLTAALSGAWSALGMVTFDAFKTQGLQGGTTSGGPLRTGYGGFLFRSFLHLCHRRANATLQSTHVGLHHARTLLDLGRFCCCSAAYPISLMAEVPLRTRAACHLTAGCRRRA